MNFKTSIAIALLFIGAQAVNAGTVISQAHELALANFQAPATENSVAAFRKCGNCKYKRVRVSSDTRYSVNDELVSLADFRKAILAVRDRSAPTVVVLHHLESDTIVSIDISI